MEKEELINNQINTHSTDEIIKNAEKMFEWVDPDLNVACRDYLQELDKIKNKVSDIIAEFSVKLLKMNKSNIVQGLEKNEINIELVNKK